MVQRLRAGAREITWYGITIREESLLRWAREKLRSVEERKAPHLMHQLQVEITVPPTLLKQIMKDYLDLGKNPGKTRQAMVETVRLSSNRVPVPD
jgi:hypothetical protein